VKVELIANLLKPKTVHFLRGNFALFLPRTPSFPDNGSMPQIIREAFSARVEQAAALETVLRDLGALSGVKVRFYAATRANGDLHPPTCEN
jgi:hypothetical protein